MLNSDGVIAHGQVGPIFVDIARAGCDCNICGAAGSEGEEDSYKEFNFLLSIDGSEGEDCITKFLCPKCLLDLRNMLNTILNQ